jgi:hypothetical protein
MSVEERMGSQLIYNKFRGWQDVEKSGARWPPTTAAAELRAVDTRTPDQPGPTFGVSDDSVGTFVYRDARTEDRGPNDWTLHLVLPDGVTPADLM